LLVKTSSTIPACQVVRGFVQPLLRRHVIRTPVNMQRKSESDEYQIPEDDPESQADLSE